MRIGSIAQGVVAVGCLMAWTVHGDDFDNLLSVRRPELKESYSYVVEGYVAEAGTQCLSNLIERVSLASGACQRAVGSEIFKRVPGDQVIEKDSYGSFRIWVVRNQTNPFRLDLQYELFKKTDCGNSIQVGSLTDAGVFFANEVDVPSIRNETYSLREFQNCVSASRQDMFWKVSVVVDKDDPISVPDDFADVFGGASGMLLYRPVIHPGFEVIKIDKKQISKVSPGTNKSSTGPKNGNGNGNGNGNSGQDSSVTDKEDSTSPKTSAVVASPIEFEELRCSDIIPDPFISERMYMVGNGFASRNANPTRCHSYENEDGTMVSVMVQCDGESEDPIPTSIQFYSGADCQNPITPLNDAVSLEDCTLFNNGFGDYYVYRCVYDYEYQGRSNNVLKYDDKVPEVGGYLTALVPTAIIIAFVIYICMTQKKKRDKLDKLQDGGPEADEEAEEAKIKTLAARLPEGSKVKKAGQLSLMGYSMTVLKIQPGKEKKGKKSKQIDDDELDRLESGGGGGEFAIELSEVKLGKLIGKGAHGKVFEGKFRGSTVAIKEFLGGRSKASFKREYRNLQSLKHPNIIRLYGMVDEENPQGARRMLVMELAKYSLGTFIKAKRDRVDPFKEGVTISTLLQWSQQICSGCSYIHGKGLIHFDIKPENLLLDEAWNIKICDLGVSRTVKSAVRAPSSDNVEGGTPSYTAPELFSGERDTLSRAVDVYSFGIVFWQFFHDEPPHPSDWNTFKLIFEVTEKEYRPTIDSSLPKPISTLIKACWSQSPSKRPSFDRLLEEFDHILGARSVDVANKLTNRPPFELGQEVYIWDHRNMRFLSTKPSMVASNIKNDGSFEVDGDSSSTSGVVMPQDLLLATRLLYKY